jgi:hypothetical protein
MVLAFPFCCGCHMGMGARPLDWDDFDASHIDKTLTEKGLLNSYRFIFWENAKGTYTQQVVANYAVSKGWQFAGNEKVDSLSMKGYNTLYRVIVNSVFKSVRKRKPDPAWFDSSGTLYKFKYILPGRNKKEAKSFHSEVLVSPDASQMCAYPLLDDS